MLINEQQQSALADKVREVESNTDAELVTVLASQSDDYRYIAWMWAAMLALLTPAIVMLLPFWLDTLEIFIAQLVVFVMGLVLLKIPALRYFLVPGHVQQSRAASLARCQFLEQNLHRTDKGMGLLIFVSEEEHYVEILADYGLSEKISDEQWQQIVDQFIQRVKANETFDGFMGCVDACGALLAEVAPVSQSKNELPNHLVILD